MMFDNFESSDKIAFTVLSDVPYSELDSEQLNSIKYNNHKADRNHHNHNESITLCTTKSVDGKVINTPVSEIPLVKDIEPIAKEERKDRQMPLCDTLFISVAWVVLPAFRFFSIMPRSHLVRRHITLQQQRLPPSHLFMSHFCGQASYISMDMDSQPAEVLFSLGVSARHTNFDIKCTSQSSSFYYERW